MTRRLIAAKEIIAHLNKAALLAQEHGFDILVEQQPARPLAMGNHRTYFALYNSRKVYSVRAKWVSVPLMDVHLCSNCREVSDAPYESCLECGATMEKPDAKGDRHAN